MYLTFNDMKAFAVTNKHGQIQLDTIRESEYDCIDYVEDKWWDENANIQTWPYWEELGYTCKPIAIEIDL